MKQTSAYQADDGSLHSTQEAAKQADEAYRRVRRGPIPINILSRVRGKPTSYRWARVMAWGAEDNSSGGSDIIYEVKYMRGDATCIYVIRHQTDRAPGKKTVDDWTVYRPSDTKPADVLYHTSRCDALPWHMIDLS